MCMTIMSILEELFYFYVKRKASLLHKILYKEFPLTYQFMIVL